VGSSLAPIGEADLALFLGRPQEAITILEPAIQSNENPFEAAAMLVAAAEAELALDRPERAVASVERAVELSRHESIQYLAARVLLAAGKNEAADEIALDLENRLQTQTTALSALIRGERALGDGQIGTAMRELRLGREEYDIWFAHYLMGRAYFEAGHYPEAIDEFDHCVRRRGEITDVFLVDSATLRFLPTALYWLGRAQEALGNTDAAAALYREYLELRGDAVPVDDLAAPEFWRRGRRPTPSLHF
jgi:tetratricopeptide (TPR) repeat protein